MKKIKSAICILVSFLMLLSSVSVLSISVFADTADYIEYVDFSDTYKNKGWRYFTSTSSAKTSISNGQMVFAGNTNSGNSFDDRAFLVADNRAVPKIESEKKYKIVFDVITTSANFANLSAQMKFYTTAGLWNPISGTPTLTSKLSALSLEKSVASGDNTVYTVSMIFTAPTLSSNCNIAFSIYGTGSGSAYKVDDVYIYAAKEYTLTDSDSNELGKLYGFVGEDIIDSLKNTEYHRFGYDVSVTPEKYPSDTNQKIVISYSAKANLVTAVDFGTGYAKGQQENYKPSSTDYVVWADGRIKFNDTSASTVAFADRAVLINNDAATTTIMPNEKYRLTLSLISWSNIEDYTLELKAGATRIDSALSDSIIINGETLKASVKSETANADGSKTYDIDVDFAFSETELSTAKNTLISLYGSTHIYLDSVLISKFYAYEVVDTDGAVLGSIVAFAGDKISDAIKDSEFMIEDYRCEIVGEDIFSENPMDKVVLKYTEITNILQYIDFSDTYAKNQRDGNGVPIWRFYSPNANLVSLSDERITFKGNINSGKDYGERGVLLSNSFSYNFITANKRYELQFELWLQNESLDTKTIDIRFGSDVWKSTNYKVQKADNLKLVNKRTEGVYTVYTLSEQIISTVDTNIMMSVYGSGNANDVLLDDVYIFEEYKYLCIDTLGNEVGYLYAFPGEEIEGLIAGSDVDKRGYFEACVTEIAPLKSSQKITIEYTPDPSFIQFIDFGSTYYRGTPGWRHYTSSNVEYSSGQMGFKSSINAGKNFNDRAILLNNDLSNLVSAGKDYIIQFDLWLKGEALSSRTVDIRVADHVWAQNSVPDLYKTTADKCNLIGSRDYGAYTIYTLSAALTAPKDGNFLLSVYSNGTGNTALVRNVEIARTTKVILANTDMQPLVGRVGHKFIMPGDIIEKGYVFDGWYADDEFNNAFTKSKYEDNNITAYAKMTEVATQAEMNFILPPPKSANMTGFEHNLINNTISANTGSSGTAYINMYAGGEAIRISPANNYPVYFKYKTENYNGNVTFGIVSAAKENFNKVQNIIATTTVNASNGWANASMCATPDIITENSVKGDYLYFFVKFEGSKNGKIFIDNIELRQETSFSFDTNGGNAIDDIKGEPGESVMLPTPINGSKVFSGWYYDSALTSKVDGLDAAYPTAKCNIKLYAGWDVADTPITVEDFEAYDTALIDKARNQRAKEVFSISNSFAYSGNTSLHYKYDPKISKSLNNIESTVKLTGNSGDSNKGIIIEKDKKYVMSLYVYAKTLNTRVDIQLFTAAGVDINTSSKIQTTSVGAARINNRFTPNNIWQKVDYVFTGNTATDTANELFLSVRAVSEIYTELYIDNVTIKELTSDMGAVAFESSVYRETLVDLEYKYIVGKVGEKIKFPKGERQNYRLLSWHNQYTYATVFADEFRDGIRTAYSQWDISGVATVDFENTGHYVQDGPGSDRTWSYTLTNGSKVVSGEKASSGNAAIKIDGSDKNYRNDTKAIALKDVDATPFRLVNNSTYIISVDIYVEEFSGNFSFWYETGSQDNYYAWKGTSSSKMIVNKDVETGKWITTTMTYSTAFTSPGGFNLFLCTNSVKGMKVYFDNIKVESVDPDIITVIMNTGLIGGSTQRMQGKLGDEYKLPNNVNVPGYAFLGWYNSSTLERRVDFEDYFTVTRTVYAKLVPKTLVQNFENSNYSFNNLYYGDTDHEIYKPGVAGYDPKNVHDGSFSLHRIGESHQFKNAMLINSHSQISPGDVYEVTMWVKMDKFDHTNGAVKIGSCSSSQFAWDLTDDMKAIVAIKDLTDKQWHKVTFKLMASAYYLVVQTPGYCSIYIDDITIEYAGAVVPDSDVEYIEYVPIRKDASGNIPTVMAEAEPTILDSKLDVYSRLDELIELYGDYSETITKTKKKSTSVTRERVPLTFKDILIGNTYVWYTVVFYSSVGAIIVIAAGITVFLAIRKKRKGV